MTVGIMPVLIKDQLDLKAVFALSGTEKLVKDISFVHPVDALPSTNGFVDFPRAA
ncbi:hypothetical protein KSF_109020 [Reticulibacter mediterranei]|uniref:Uncharacterized protein n=1 Tax=Reticulibacter mediterranei TaxID=2778369 RepID=A0A8J3N757_9CHLR|nr:hypothetical protein KSF_109020 [Reticulibacter mediterranei]